MAEIYRSFEPDLEIRSAKQGGDGRTIVGIAVPYNYAQRIDSQLTEQFARGAFDHQLKAAHRVVLSRDHVNQGGKPIGKTMLLRDDAAGLYGEWQISKTSLGDETLELLKDGVLDQLSIGFRETPNGNRRIAGGIVERTKADLREVSVVLRGAYGDNATVSGIREESAVKNIDLARQIIAGLPILPPR